MWQFLVWVQVPLADGRFQSRYMLQFGTLHFRNYARDMSKGGVAFWHSLMPGSGLHAGIYPHVLLHSYFSLIWSLDSGDTLDTRGSHRDDVTRDGGSP